MHPPQPHISNEDYHCRRPNRQRRRCFRRLRHYRKRPYRTGRKGKEIPRGIYDKCLDVTGCFVLPGIIDSHVHFREPGLTAKADIESESRAAAYGGVTSYFDMPNTVPQTSTHEAWNDKMQRASRESHVNYAFFFGATNDNASVFRQIDTTRLPGIKLFMGSSTGNMLVDRLGSLIDVFKTCAALNLPLMSHCEDSTIIDSNMKRMKEAYGDDPLSCCIRSYGRRRLATRARRSQ